MYEEILKEETFLISSRKTLEKLCIKLEQNLQTLDVIIDLINARIHFTKEAIDKEKEFDFVHNLYEKYIIPCFTEYLSNQKYNQSLELSNCFLLSYFLYRLNRDLIKDSNLLNDYSLEEKWTFFRYTGESIKYYFYTHQERKKRQIVTFTFKDLDPIKYIEAICYLVGEYTNKYLKIERCFDIGRHLKLFFSSQTLLYFLKVNYRDHLFHMIDICFLGFFLLSTRVKKNSKLEGLISKKSNIDREGLLKNWFVAALFHDIGYILSLYDYVQKEVGFVTSPEIDKIKNDLASIYSKEAAVFNKDFSEKLRVLGIDTKEISNLQTFDHGVISAAHVMNIIISEYSGSVGLEDKIEEYLPAISAMAHHNLLYTEQSVEVQPIGVLLTLLDELQEWERQSVENLPLRDKLAASIRFNNPFASGSKSVLDVIHIQVKDNFNPFKNNGHLSMTGDLHFVLDYTGAKDQIGFKPLYAWLLKSHKLQRLSLDGLLNVQITFINAIRDHGLEYDYLKNKRRESRKWSFEEWIDMVKKSHKREGDKEYLSINVKELNDKKPLKRHPLEDLIALNSSGK